MKRLFIGTSGYNYRDWEGVFYPQDLPQKEWLIFYSKHFNTVEINATFYGNFKKHVFETWASKAENDFCFSIKGSRYITHIKRIKNSESIIQNFFENAQGLGDRLGVVLWQFAGNFKNNRDNLERLEKFIQILPKDTRQTIEFRSRSWFTGEIFELLDKHKIGFVINDSGVFPSIEKITGNFAYIRFHGPSALYSSSYSDKELKTWAEKIKSYLLKYDVYCYFNNDVGGYAVNNALKLKEFLEHK